MFIEIYLLIQVALIPVIVHEFQLNLLEASLIATLPSVVSLLINIPSGFLADRFSTNQLLFASMIIEGVSAFVVSQTSSFWALVVGVTFMRAASPIYHVAGLSQISRITRPEQISRSVGFHNALGSVGSTLGLVSLTIFLSTTGWRSTYLVWSFPIIIWGFILLMSSQLKIKQAKVQTDQSKSRSSRFFTVLSPALALFLLVIAVRELGATGSSTFMTTYFVNFRSLPDATASLIFALGPVVGIIGSIGGGFFAEKLGARRALKWTIACCSVSLLALSMVSSLYLLAFVYLMYSLFNNALWSPMNTIVASITPETSRGLSYSMYFFTEGFMDSIAPTIAAGVIEASSVWSVFPFSVVFFIISLVIFQFLPRFHGSEVSSKSQIERPQLT